MRTNFGYIYNKEFFEYLNISIKGTYVSENGKKVKKFYFYPLLTEQIIVEEGSKKKKKTIDSEFGEFNKKFLEFKLKREDVKIVFDKSKKNQTINEFQLKTIYPGLLSGSGYLHEVGEKNNDEFQLGFYFDHTTGLPVIPASSIKGVLRYACEMIKDTKDKDYFYRYEKLKEEVGFSVGEKYFTPIVKKIGKEEKKFPSEFVYNVFEGKEIVRKDGKIEFDKKGAPVTKGISIYQRDIFHDAFPVKSKKSLFGSDYITHHEHPLKNPNPVQFLRVQPEVTFQFQFDLKDSNGLTAENKLELFKQIILDFGLGAKTNVGYGQFDAI